MKIRCTVNEFAALVRGCLEFRNSSMSCAKCPLNGVCKEGFIEQFVKAEDVVEEDDEWDI